MRISTNSIYDLGVAGIEQQQSALLKTQQQLSTGNRILTPSDDPIAAAEALQVGEASATNDQYAANRSSAESSLGMESNVLQSITNLVQSIRTNVVSAGNATMTDSDRAALATTLTGQFQALMGLANSTDGAGQYLFSGYDGATQPYAGTVGNVKVNTTNNNQGVRVIQASSGNQVAVSDSGYSVFQNIKTGNGTFTTSASSANTGSGTISVGSVTGAQGTQDTYTISFDGNGNYSVTDTNKTTGNPVATGTYTPGGDITFNGWTVQVSGTPAAGDTFTVQPSMNQDIFTTVGNIITALKQPASTAAGSAQLTTALGSGLANIDEALNNLLSVQASVGTRIQELSNLDSLGSNTNLQYQKTLSQLTNVDYTKAASDLTLEQTYLTAAQKSFTAISGLSLFNYLP